MATLPRSNEPRTTPAGAARVALWPVACLFFASGASALVYQVSWQRILALHTGVGIQSVAVIVSAYMAGLGLGSEAAGRLSLRLSRLTALRLFAAAEILIALFAAMSPGFYHDWLTTHASALYATPARMAATHFLSLLVPTALMGASLPLLVHALVRDTGSAARTIGRLYGVNVLGAAAGALLTPWVLLRFFGIEGAILVGVAGNALAGVGALALATQRGADAPSPASPPTAAVRTLAAHGQSLRLWLALYATSGFVALALEVLWFRIVDVAVKSTAFTFGTVLALYLLGYGLGSTLGARPGWAKGDPLRRFLLYQCALLAWAAAVPLAIAWLPSGVPGYDWFAAYWAQYDGFRLGGRWAVGTFVRLYLVLPIVLYGVPTVLMGLSFPELQRAVQDDPQTSGRKVGLLQAVNIFGCTAGSLAAGLVLLDLFGTTGTLRALVAVGIGFALVGVRAYGWRPFGAVAAGLAVLAIALPSQERFWLRLHGVAPGGFGLLEEDATGVAAITREDERRFRVCVNGKGDSWLPYGGIHTFLGALPVLVHPAPVDVAVIGLGSGDSAWAASARRETRSVTVFELLAPQTRLLQRLSQEAAPDGLREFLRDGRVRVRVADGRNALVRDPALYDVIVVDALRPESAYSGNVYSEEFFRAGAARLRPGGVMATWVPTNRAYATFVGVFPHAIALDGGQILVGSNDPLVIDAAAFQERLDDAPVRLHFGDERVEAIRRRLAAARPAERKPRVLLGRNVDLFPRDEFGTPAATR
jgi:spermidine synthase